jgi:hypothetical protein
MKIESSNILLSSQHSSIEKHTVKESLRMWVGDQRPDPSVGLRAGFEGRSRQQPNPAPAIGSVRLSSEALAAAQADTAKQAAAVDPEKELENDPRYLLIKLMVEALTGKQVKLVKMEDVQPAQSAQDIPDPKQAAAPEQPKPAGYGVEYDRHETHYESEQTSFSAEGVVKTADGREIRFNLALSMSREYFEQSDVSLRLGDAKMKDPLVINFGGTAAQLTDTKFSFDLDADGKTDQISFVGAGSGFLALDKNADGKINNGSELFGPASGNGFQELAAYDLDKNSWIDENDAVYTQLKVWTKDGSGNDALSTLAQTKVGAIYLGNVSTPFDIKNGQNQLDGQVRTSGVYLNEDGGAGTVQQIDLAV